MDMEVVDTSKKQQLQSLLQTGQFAELEALAFRLVKNEPANSEWFHFYILALIEQNKLSTQLGDAIDMAIFNFSKDARFFYYGAVCAIKFENNLNKALLYCAFALSMKGEESSYQQLFTRLISATSKSFVKFIFLPDWKIGHLVFEADLWYRKWQNNPQHDVYYVMVYGDTLCNSAVIDFYRRKLAVADNCAQIHKIYRKAPHFLADTFVESMPYNSIVKSGTKGWAPDPEAFYSFGSLRDGTQSILELTAADMAKGNKLLRKMGIDPESDRYVCLAVRTNDYYKKTFEGVEYANTDWSFTDSRNANISNYQAAIDYLLEQDIYVIRMGKIVNERFEHSSDKFIDYSYDFRHQLDGDFMDIFLLGTCEFFICNLNGIAQVSQVMGVPVLMLNTSPWLPPHTTEDDLYVPKMLRNIEDHRVVNYQQNVQLLIADTDAECDIPFMTNTYKLKKLGWEYIENEADELLEATKEMWAKVIGKSQWNKSDQQIINQFRDFLPPSHWVSNIETAASPYFLKKHQKELGLV